MAGVQSIQRAFRLLRLLGTGPLGVTELSEKALLPKSTTARLLSALEDEGAVARVDGGTDYCLGAGLADLAGAVLPGRNLAAVARPFLVALSESTGETAGISVLSDDSVYYLDHVTADTAVQPRNWTGDYAPLHAVPSGMVILATADEASITAYLGRSLEKFTPKTETDIARLRVRLAAIRQFGYAWGYEEFAEGVNSVAAAVRGSDGGSAIALHIHGPAYRFPDPDDTHDIGLALLEAARQLSDQLEA